MAEAAAAGARFRGGMRREALIYTDGDVWPGASPAQLTELMPIISDQMASGNVYQDDPSLTGSGEMAGTDKIASRPSGPVTYRLRYQGFDTLLACALGFMAKRIGGTVMPEQLAAGAYRHLFEVDTTLHATAWQSGDGFVTGAELQSGQRKVRRFTHVGDRGVRVHEFLSCMVEQVTIAATVTDVRVTGQFHAYSRDMEPLSNTRAHMQSLILSGAPNVHLFQAKNGVRIAPYSTVTPLGSGDIVAPSELTTTITNHLALDTHDAQSGIGIAQPARNGFLEAMQMFQFARYTAQNQAFLQGADDDTWYMAQLRFVGPEIAATGINYEINVYLPYFKFTGITAAINDASLVAVPGEAKLFRPPATPAGFPANVRGGSIMIETINGNSAHALLAA
jgi:hypothetical protein